MSDSEDMSDFNAYGDSDGYSPVPVVKSKAKAPAKPAAKKAAAPKAKAAPKAMTQTKLTMQKAKSAKRAKPDSEDESAADRDSLHDDSLLADTPPSTKKQKTAPTAKKSSGKPLEAIENDSMILDGPTEPKPKKGSATDRYQKLTQLEHIIKRPDTYIGSVERTEQPMWVFNSETEQMEFRKVSFVPGLYKIFDEILVNAADNKQNDPNMSHIKVNIDREKGEISIENNGKGIPIEIHSKENIYIPEMIFGHLLTSSNYDDEEAKTTGGRNGYGAKLCNIFSTEFTLETADSKSGKKYKQTWTDNMGKMGKAKITANKSQDYTRVTFTPDFNKFKMFDGMDDDFEGLAKRRVYDMAGTVKKVKVYLNEKLIKVNNFKKYIEMYAKAINKERGLEDGPETSATNSVIVDDSTTHERWEIGFAVSDGSFQQVSFVNSIATTSGGTHVNYIADQICTKLMDVVKKKNKQGASLKANQIRNHIFLFVNCLITNPAFTSQTKEQLTTKTSQFGSKCVVTEDFLKKIAKTDAVTNILHFAQQKADQVLAKSDGNRRSRMSNPKLVDANLAGTKRGHECTLILTEGDSARGLAVAGRAVLDPDRIGVFPLRGKLLNVRDASIDQISKNAEIQNIKQFLGLKHKQTYTDTKGLRYGHLMIMADQDHDGSHIKGLLINFLQVSFPSLLKLPDFFREFITPIVKVWKGNNPKKLEGARSFFTMPQYEEWKEQHKGERNWSHKYYKGLGTSSNEDAQIYFKNLDDHLKEFRAIKEEEEELFDLAFSKKKADARKQWLGNFVPGTYLDHSTKRITYDDFVNKELILFSMADNMRSIPSVLDGLKPGQRKVLFSCFKRNLVKDMKVVELAGYVSGLTAYQHGETSLQQTITGLAQTFVGSNNINCLEPSGNFGSRLQGGSDCASARYIYTRLSPFARRIFSQLDEPLLTYNTDDDRKIEPEVYCPVVPMVLINGADGIGTGWSTSIPNYHPEDIVRNLKRRMERADDAEGPLFEPMMPWFRGWKGTVEEAGPDRFKFNGIVEESGDNEIEITELPIRMWTDDFKAKLEEIIKGEKTPSFIKDYKEFNDHLRVHFIIQMDEKHMKAALAEGLHERFKLNKTIATSNLVAFDRNGRIRKYDKVEEILEEFYDYRLEMYSKRKAHQLEVMHKEYRKLTNQARFVTEIIDGKLIVSKKKKPVLVSELRKAKYEAFPKVTDAKKSGELDDVVENDEEIGEDEDHGARDYDYLLGMPIWSLTQERVDKLKQAMRNKKDEYDTLERLSEKDLWTIDLDAFLEEWSNQLKEDSEVQSKIRKMGRRTSNKIGAGMGKGRKTKRDEEEDYAPTKAAARSKPKADLKNAVKVEPKKSAQSIFAAMKMSSPQPKQRIKNVDGTADDDDVEEVALDSDDDFAMLAPEPAKTSSKPSAKSSKTPSEEPVASKANGRSKRAAAAKPKAWVESNSDDSESDDGQMLDDIGDLVKGIGSGAASNINTSTNGRVSLFGMTRPGSSSDAAPKPVTSVTKSKPKSKAPKAFEDDEDDETNYDMLAKTTSPRKSTAAADKDLDDFLSDDEDVLAVAPKKAAAKTAPKPKIAAKTKAAPKKTASSTSPEIEKPTALSPAAKAYASKQKKTTKASPVTFSSDEDEDLPPVKAKKPAAKSAPIDLSDDDEDESLVIPKKRAVKPAPVDFSDDDEDESLIVPKKRASKPAPVEDSDDDSDEIDVPAVKPKKVAATKPAAKPAAKSAAKPAAKPAVKPKKPVQVSEDEDEEMLDADSPPPAPRGRPARAAVAKAKKVYVLSDDDDEEDSEVAIEEDEQSEDDFDESD